MEGLFFNVNGGYVLSSASDSACSRFLIPIPLATSKASCEDIETVFSHHRTTAI